AETHPRAARRAAGGAMFFRIPGIARRAVMRVVTGPAESEFDHMRLAGDGGELAPEICDHRPVLLELRRQALGRAGVGRESRMREEILDRSRDALQRARARTDRIGRIGRIGAAARMIGRPLRIGHQRLAEAIVMGDRLFGESTGFDLALTHEPRQLDHWTREQIAHCYLPLSITRLSRVRSIARLSRYRPITRPSRAGLPP